MGNFAPIFKTGHFLVSIRFRIAPSCQLSYTIPSTIARNWAESRGQRQSHNYVLTL